MVFRNQLVREVKGGIIYFISVKTEKNEKQKSCQVKKILRLA